LFNWSFDPDDREIFARVRSIVNVQKEFGSLSSCRKNGSGKTHDWKCIQEKLVEKGHHRAPELLSSEKIRIILDIFCEQSASSRDSR